MSSLIYSKHTPWRRHNACTCRGVQSENVRAVMSVSIPLVGEAEMSVLCRGCDRGSGAWPSEGVAGWGRGQRAG